MFIAIQNVGFSVGNISYYIDTRLKVTIKTDEEQKRITKLRIERVMNNLLKYF